MPGSQSSAVLITRPEEDALEYESELQNLGFKVLVDPMLVIKPVEFEPAPLDGFQGLLFTSAHAVRFFSEDVLERNIPVYVVGERTKAEVERFGYNTVFSADGTGVDLVELVKEHITDQDTLLVHVRGLDVARDLSEDLGREGFRVQKLIVYKAQDVDRLRDETLYALGSGALDAVTFFSKRTAQVFLRNVEEANLSGALADIKALCISESVLKCVQAFSWSGTYVAQRPNRQGMLELLQRYGRG